MKFWSILGALLVLTSCADQDSAAPSLMTATATETMIATAATTSPPRSTQAPLHIAEPLVTAPRLRFDSWSPDSQWIAYWSAEGNDLPAQLAFVDAQSGQICQQEGVRVNNIWCGYVSWVEDGNAIAVQNAGRSALRGIPCKEFSSTEAVTITRTADSISPDTEYRAETTVTGGQEQLIHNVVTITQTSTGKIAVSIEWKGSPHVWAESGWLNNELFLVGLDVYQGLLYVSVPDGKVGNVISDLLGLDVQEVGYISRVGRYTDLENAEYHLLIERSKDGPLPLLLYHSELDLVEELAFNRSWLQNGWTFSPDGQWLFPFQPSIQQNETDDLWIRAVDPPESVAWQVMNSRGVTGFALSSQKLALIRNNLVNIMDFSGSQLLSRWRTLDYGINRLWWSPDGRHLVMQGFSAASTAEVLFIVQP